MVISKRQIVLIIHNVRSAHNVGSLLRTADGLGVQKVIISGYSPYPRQTNDSRLPHLTAKVHHQISKTALGAEASANWQYFPEIDDKLNDLKATGYLVAALEQTKRAKPLNEYIPPPKIALIVGSELGGVEPALLDLTDIDLQIPMLGSKESFNVAAAAAMALYHLRYM